MRLSGRSVGIRRDVPSSTCMFLSPDRSRRTRVTKWFSRALTASQRAAQQLATLSQKGTRPTMQVGTHSLTIDQKLLAMGFWVPQVTRNRLILSVRLSNWAEHSLASTLYLSIAYQYRVSLR